MMQTKVQEIQYDVLIGFTQELIKCETDFRAVNKITEALYCWQCGERFGIACSCWEIKLQSIKKSVYEKSIGTKQLLS